MKKVFFLVLMCIGILYAETDSTSVFTNIWDYYKNKNNLPRRDLPFGYYANESGFMFGNFYYDSDFMKKDASLIFITLWSPKTGTTVFYFKERRYPLTENLILDADAHVIKFDEIRGHWPGNDSPDCEAEYAYVHDVPAAGDSTYLPINRGYSIIKGWMYTYKLHLGYKINENTTFFGGANYKELRSHKRKYMTDELEFRLEYDNSDNPDNPHTGFHGILSLNRGLNLLSHDGDNAWDYYKIKADARQFLPLSKSVTLALRGALSTTGGKKVIDRDRTFALNYGIGKEGEVSTVAPFFDQSALGDFDDFKGFYVSRFYDMHSILWQAEIRWQMRRNLQTVAFFETGRVVHSFKASDFFSEYKFCGGIGLRYFFSDDIILRGDWAASNEQKQVRLNTGQVF